MKIDPKVIKFIFAVLIVGTVIEITDSVSHKAALTMVLLITLGILLNNQLALALINIGANSLGDNVK